MQIKFRDISEQESMKMLDKAIMRAEMQEPRKASQSINYQNYLENFHTLLELIQNGNEKIKMVSVVFTCYGKTKEELNKIVNTCKNQLIKEQMKINPLKYQQLEFYFSIFKDNKITKNIYQKMATVSIASSYPFVLPTIKDDGGLLLGANEHNSPVVFDVKHRDSFRNSSNVVVFGLTGSGKTMDVKKQLN
jgi:type IV secretory pathway VirB4 component